MLCGVAAGEVPGDAEEDNDVTGGVIIDGVDVAGEGWIGSGYLGILDTGNPGTAPAPLLKFTNDGYSGFLITGYVFLPLSTLTGVAPFLSSFAVPKNPSLLWNVSERTSHTYSGSGSLVNVSSGLSKSITDCSVPVTLDVKARSGRYMMCVAVSYIGTGETWLWKSRLWHDLITHTPWGFGCRSKCFASPTVNVHTSFFVRPHFACPAWYDSGCVWVSVRRNASTGFVLSRGATTMATDSGSWSWYTRCVCRSSEDIKHVWLGWVCIHPKMRRFCDRHIFRRNASPVSVTSHESAVPVCMGSIRCVATRTSLEGGNGIGGGVPSVLACVAARIHRPTAAGPFRTHPARIAQVSLPRGGVRVFVSAQASKRRIKVCGMKSGRKYTCPSATSDEGASVGDDIAFGDAPKGASDPRSLADTEVGVCPRGDSPGIGERASRSGYGEALWLRPVDGGTDEEERVAGDVKPVPAVEGDG